MLVRRLENSFMELIFPSTFVWVLGIEFRLSDSQGKRFYPLSHITSPVLVFLSPLIYMMASNSKSPCFTFSVLGLQVCTATPNCTTEHEMGKPRVWRLSNMLRRC